MQSNGDATGTAPVHQKRDYEQSGAQALQQCAAKRDEPIIKPYHYGLRRGREGGRGSGRLPPGPGASGSNAHGAGSSALPHHCLRPLFADAKVQQETLECIQHAEPRGCKERAKGLRRSEKGDSGGWKGAKDRANLEGLGKPRA